MGLLKAKLARYRAQLLEPTAKSSGGGTGFDVQKSGDARIALIGFPSVGKARCCVRWVLILLIYPAHSLLYYPRLRIPRQKLRHTNSPPLLCVFSCVSSCVSHPLVRQLNTLPAGNSRCHRIQGRPYTTARSSWYRRRSSTGPWSRTTSRIDCEDG